MIKVPEELFDAGDESVRQVFVVLAAGADTPGPQTPLVDAETVTLDRMAREGHMGLVEPPADAESGFSDWDGFVRLLGLRGGVPSLGVAAALGARIEVPPGHAVYRADFVTVDDDGVRDVGAGQIDEPEASVLLDAVREAIRVAVPGVGLHRLAGPHNLVVLPEFAGACRAPWEVAATPPAEAMPAIGPLRAIYLAASEALSRHDVNAVRVDLGENPANALWLHGGGVMPAQSDPPKGLPLPHAGVGAVASTLVGSGVPLGGLAQYLGVPFARTGDDLDELAAGALDALSDHDLVVVRTSAALRVARGDVAARREALSAIDARLIAPLLSALEERGPFQLTVAADSILDAEHWRIAPASVPFVELSSAETHDPLERTFTERACVEAGLRRDAAALLTANRTVG